MMHFKNHNSGFSFIEVMIAMILLATFGTSLFRIQTFIFQNSYKAHNKAIITETNNQIVPELDVKLAQIKQEKKSYNEIVTEKNVNQSEIKIKTIIKPINEKSSLFKEFKETLSIVEITNTASSEEKSISFLFNPYAQQEKT